MLTCDWSYIAARAEKFIKSTELDKNIDSKYKVHKSKVS